MKKTALVLATVTALAVGTVGTTTPAQARWGHGGWGWGPGIAGGLIAGAVIGGIASSAYGWGPGYGYHRGRAPAQLWRFLRALRLRADLCLLRAGLRLSLSSRVQAGLRLLWRAISAPRLASSL